MNDRIRQLAEQAHLYNDDDNFLTAALEHFAELIVAECVDICQQAIKQNNQTRDLLKEDELAEKMVIHGSIKQAEKLSQGIKQHFGVEE